jgi:hypothetical protein
MPLAQKEDPGANIDFKRRKNWSCYNTMDPIEDFVSWLLTAFSSKNTVIIFSHNGGRY